MKALKCRECGREYPLTATHVCEFDFGPLEVVYDYDRIKKSLARTAIESRPHSMWRYRELLPVANDPTVGLQVGFTPLVKADRLAKKLGIRELWIKNDTVNYPTGLVVPLGIDLAEFASMPAPGRFRARYPEIGDKPFILFFGRVNFKKGLDILAKAFGVVARRRPDVHLVIAGPDNEGWGARVRTWLSEEGVLGRTTFTGMLLGPDKLAVLRDASLFVLPSYSENFGLAVIEAMAAGLPVIISDQVNIWREVEAGRAGRVIPCDPGALADQILELLANPDTAADLGRKGRALVQERYPWPRIGRSLAEAYGRIIDEHRRNRERKPTQSRPQVAPDQS